jgi:hypothetical protein
MKTESKTRSRWYRITLALLFALGLAVPGPSQAAIYTIELNSTPTNPSLDIFPFDIVRWEVTETSPYQIELSGAENITGGALHNIGDVFQWTFHNLGVTNYVDVLHPGLIFGTITVSEGSPSEVPLPAALSLFAGGLSLLGWLARRRRQAQTA